MAKRKRKRTQVEKWWNGRGYDQDPFRKFNASDLDDNEIPTVFDLWCVDPDTEISQNLLVETALLDFLTSKERSPIFLYVPQGGGKTFYRRWAAYTTNKSKNCFAVEIDNLRGRVHKHHNQVSGEDIVKCLYVALCNALGIIEQTVRINNVTRGLVLCEQLVEKQDKGQCFIFLDGIETLFDSKTRDMMSSPLHEAVITLLNGIASYESKNLAIRVFIPSFLNTLQDRLEFRSKIKKKNITWSPKHCETIIEKRLDSCWKEGSGIYRGHIGKLLNKDALQDFQLWVRQQNALSPRCVIRTLSSLIEFARKRGVESDQISLEIWSAFSKTAEAKFCTSDQPKSRSKGFIKTVLPEWLGTVFKKIISWLFGALKMVLKLIRSLGQTVRSIISWIASVQDYISAFLVLITVLGGVILVAWCIIQNQRTGNVMDLGQCLRDIWQFIATLF